MKITRRQLRRAVREEIRQLSDIHEGLGVAAITMAPAAIPAIAAYVVYNVALEPAAQKYWEILDPDTKNTLETIKDAAVMLPDAIKEDIKLHVIEIIEDL